MTFLYEGKELVSETGKTYLAVGALGQNNVWVATEKDNDNNIVILKAPASFDTAPWPNFMQELTMHELFKDCSSIRRHVDRIPPSEDASSPPVLVLEILQTTLQTARAKRPFSRAEIGVVIKGILEGIRDVHARGLVYADMKMENFFLDGFDINNPGDGSNLVVKLGDLGTVTEPGRGTAQPIAYRAPEIFFRTEMTQASDLWAAGLILSHLIEARTDFSSSGLYSNLAPSAGMRQQMNALESTLANDYDLRNVDYYKDCSLPATNHDHSNHWDTLKERGLEEQDIEILKHIMKCDPRDRPSVEELLRHPWFRNAASSVATHKAAAAPTGKDTTMTDVLRSDEQPRHHVPVTDVPREYMDQATSTIDKSQDRLSAQGVTSVQLGKPAHKADAQYAAAPPISTTVSATGPAPIQFTPVKSKETRTEPSSACVSGMQFTPFQADEKSVSAQAQESSPQFAVKSATKEAPAPVQFTPVQVNNSGIIDNKVEKESTNLQPVPVAPTRPGPGGTFLSYR